MFDRTEWRTCQESIAIVQPGQNKNLKDKELVLSYAFMVLSYASVSTVLATEGIYSDHNHGYLCPPPSQHRPGTQGTVQEYK